MFDRIKTLFSGTADPDTLGHDFEAKQLAAAAADGTVAIFIGRRRRRRRGP